MLKILYSSLANPLDKQILKKITQKPPFLDSGFFNNNINYSNTSIYARLLCLYYLETYHLIKNAIISYRYHQKPFISNYRNLHFNFTHSGNTVMLAIADFEVGIDLQYINPDIKEPLKLAKKLFSEAEMLYLNSLPKNSIINSFFRLWTEKEAFAKCEGTGLSIYKSFSFDTLNQKTILYNNSSYHMRELDLSKKFAASVCSKNKIEQPDILYIESEAVLDFYT